MYIFFKFFYDNNQQNVQISFRIINCKINHALWVGNYYGRRKLLCADLWS